MDCYFWIDEMTCSILLGQEQSKNVGEGLQFDPRRWLPGTSKRPESGMAIALVIIWAGCDNGLIILSLVFEIGLSVRTYSGGKLHGKV